MCFKKRLLFFWFRAIGQRDTNAFRGDEEQANRRSNRQANLSYYFSKDMVFSHPPSFPRTKYTAMQKLKMLTLLASVCVCRIRFVLKVLTTDYVEINHVMYRILDEPKVVTQPLKIIRTLDAFKPKIER